jgi:FKBP-type peptidyl-prolyl cis-trans isomerase FkpA
MPRFEALLVLATLIATAGCENTQTVSETKTQTAPAIQQASLPVDKSMPDDLMETSSGLKYKVVKSGDLNKKPTAANSVLAHYEGWLEDGTIFDSSYDRGEPASFPLNQVIAGWTEGLQLIGEGGEIRLVIPGDLAYGPGGMPPTIPPNATLNFKVELIEVQ